MSRHNRERRQQRRGHQQHRQGPRKQPGTAIEPEGRWPIHVREAAKTGMNTTRTAPACQPAETTGSESDCRKLLNALRVHMVRQGGQQVLDVPAGFDPGHPGAAGAAVLSTVFLAATTAQLAAAAGLPVPRARGLLGGMLDDPVQYPGVERGDEPDSWVMGCDDLEPILKRLGIEVDYDVPEGDGFTGGMLW
jgi:hypothetical protein